jgi:nitrogenase subunit NifH
VKGGIGESTVNDELGRMVKEELQKVQKTMNWEVCTRRNWRKYSTGKDLKGGIGESTVDDELGIV